MKTKVIMVQGTMSNVGKSLLVGGLCRVFKQDGYRVMPFKSQNMALNSFVTEDGLELGRAQAMQAECAGVKPSVYMNPVLLKPTNDIGSQVIVNGEVIGNMPAREYFKYKKKLIPDILAAYHELEKQADIIVVEGAGSPAEINLKADDIVNMGLAKLIDAPVLLVGDIDRGGVFAQLLGTLELLEKDERERVKGLIINKFRGDKSLLDSGIEMIEEMGHVPVVGTVPYTRLLIDDEDSLSERLTDHRQESGPSIEVAVVRLPRISNFTDVAPFESIDGVNVRFITNPRDIESADLIIIPGSKNTIGDLRWMRESGMEASIKRKSASCPVIGICGGFQMLGGIISDPDKVEEGGSIKGLGLLPVETMLKDKKRRTQCEGTFDRMDGFFEVLSGAKYTGYEIHMGETKGRNGKALLSCQQRNAFGTYVHGVFDEGDIALDLVKKIADKKGIKLGEAVNYKAFKENEYDRLANVVRDNLDMDYIYSILG